MCHSQSSPLRDIATLNKPYFCGYIWKVWLIKGKNKVNEDSAWWDCVLQKRNKRDRENKPGG